MTSRDEQDTTPAGSGPAPSGDLPVAGPRSTPPGSPAAARSFTTSELEAVIRRAVELQASNSSRTEEGIPATDIVRIGTELGIEPDMVRRAMAEVQSRPPEEKGALVAMVGTRTARATRVIRRPAAGIAAQLDRHLRESESLVPQRRFGQRTHYVRDSSIGAVIAHFARSFSRAHKPLDVSELDLSVSPLDAESCLVEFSVDLGTTRGGLLAGVFGTSSAAAAGWATAVWATPIADPLVLLGVPVLAGAWYGMRAIYNSIQGGLEVKLESLLDRVEHDELR